MKRWSLGRRLVGAFAVIALIALPVALAAMYMLDTSSSRLEKVMANEMPILKLATEFERELLNARPHFVYFLTVQSAGSLNQGRQRYESAGRKLNEIESLSQSLQMSEERRRLVGEMRRAYNDYGEYLQKVSAMISQQQNSTPEFARISSEWTRLGGVMVEIAGRMGKEASEQTLSESQAASDSLHRALVLTVVGGTVAGALGLVLLAITLVSTNRTLRRLVAELKLGSEQVAVASSHLSQASQTLALGASRQAAAVEETSAAVRRSARSYIEARSTLARLQAWRPRPSIAQQVSASALTR